MIPGPLDQRPTWASQLRFMIVFHDGPRQRRPTFTADLDGQISMVGSRVRQLMRRIRPHADG